MRSPTLAILVSCGLLSGACLKPDPPVDNPSDHQDASAGDSGPLNPDSGAEDSGRDASVGADAATSDAAQPDAGALGDAGAGQDAGLHDAGSSTDSGPRADAGNPFAGTALEGITVRWTDALHLCDSWSSGQSLQDARARKVELVLPPHPRTGLTRDDAQQATLSTGVLRTGPLSNTEWHLEEMQVGSTVKNWELLGTAEDAMVSISIEHRLGDRFTLWERVNVNRKTGETRPVEYTGNGDESSFSLLRDGTLYPLTACQPAASERAVVVLSASGSQGNITVLREQLLGPEVVPGTPSVIPLQTEVMVNVNGIYSPEPISARGFWTHVHTADVQGHAHEYSSVAFNADPRWYHGIFAPMQAGHPPEYPPVFLKELRLLDVNNGTPSATSKAELQWVTLATGGSQLMSWEIRSDLKRVDADHLQRQIQARLNCSGRVSSYGAFATTGMYLLQLGFCPSASGGGDQLVMVTPVYLPGAIADVGTPAWPDSMAPVSIDGIAGTSVTLPHVTIQLAPQSGGFLGRVLNGSGVQVDQTSFFDADLFSLLPNPVDVLKLGDATGQVKALLSRAYVMQGAGHSSIYAPVFFELTFNGQTHRVDAMDKLHYENTHHNWDDFMTADTTTVRLEWSVEGFGGHNRVRAVRLADGVEVLPPTNVTLVE